MSDLREALDRVGGPLASDELLIHDAARRFLALTETGPDYEAAYDELGHIEPSRVKQAVDAALADYLTEEE